MASEFQISAGGTLTLGVQAVFSRRRCGLTLFSEPMWRIIAEIGANARRRRSILQITNYFCRHKVKRPPPQNPATSIPAK